MCKEEELKREKYETRRRGVLWKFTTGHSKAQSRPHTAEQRREGPFRTPAGDTTLHFLFYEIMPLLVPSPSRTRVIMTQIANLSSVLKLRV